MAESTAILTEKVGDVLKITLNKPERLNAMSPDMADEFGAAFYDLQGARAILVTGAGKGFCSGADLAARGEASAFNKLGGSHRSLMNHYNPAVAMVLRAPVPVVCAVNGAAAGVGCSIGLAGDFVLAGRSAYFLQAFANIGLIPDGGSTWMLAKTIGRARATQMMMLAEKISAEQAHEWGLTYAVVDDDKLQDEAMALATRLAAGPTVSYSRMKRNIMAAMDSSLSDVLMAEAEGQRIASASSDATEGGAAFLEKRKPQFQGK